MAVASTARTYERRVFQDTHIVGPPVGYGPANAPILWSPFSKRPSYQLTKIEAPLASAAVCHSRCRPSCASLSIRLAVRPTSSPLCPSRENDGRGGRTTQRLPTSVATGRQAVPATHTSRKRAREKPYTWRAVASLSIGPAAASAAAVLPTYPSTKPVIHWDAAGHLPFPTQPPPPPPHLSALLKRGQWASNTKTPRCHRSPWPPTARCRVAPPVGRPARSVATGPLMAARVSHPCWPGSRVRSGRGVGAQCGKV